MTRLRLTLSEHGEIVVAVFEGEIDASNVASTADQIFAALSPEMLGAVFDLSAARYVDSAGIGLFFDAARKLAARRQRLAIALPDTSPLRRLFEITRISTVADVCGSVDECIAEVRERADEGRR